MKFEWDENKRRENLLKHGIDFADAWQVFEGNRVIFIDDRFDYDELRLVTIGFLSGNIVTVTYTENDEITRIISLRKATKNERTKYIKGIPNRLGENWRIDRRRNWPYGYTGNYWRNVGESRLAQRLKIKFDKLAGNAGCGQRCYRILQSARARLSKENQSAFAGVYGSESNEMICLELSIKFGV